MNKAAIASLLALSAFTVAPALLSHHGAAFAQAPTGQVQMDAPEFADYDNCMNKQTQVFCAHRCPAAHHAGLQPV